MTKQEEQEKFFKLLDYIKETYLKYSKSPFEYSEERGFDKVYSDNNFIKTPSGTYTFTIKINGGAYFDW